MESKRRFKALSTLLYIQLACLALATLGTIYSRAHLTHEYWRLGGLLAQYERLVEIAFTVGAIGLVICPLAMLILARQWWTLAPNMKLAFAITEVFLLAASWLVLLPGVQ
jgi:hypothetical protein